jgi:hypothetical protein
MPTTARITRPDPTSSTSVPAISSAINTDRVSRIGRPGGTRPPVAPQGLRQPALPWREQRQQRHGERERQANTADDQEHGAVDRNRRLAAGRRTSELSFDERREESIVSAVVPSARASATAQRQAASSSSMRTDAQRPAPRAARKTKSLCRRSVRSSISTATFAQTMSSTRPQAIVTPMRTGRSGATYRSRTDSSSTPLQSGGRSVATWRAASVIRRSAASTGTRTAVGPCTYGQRMSVARANPHARGCRAQSRSRAAAHRRCEVFRSRRGRSQPRP